jgi:hypothetical protein
MRNIRSEKGDALKNSQALRRYVEKVKELVQAIKRKQKRLQTS